MLPPKFLTPNGYLGPIHRATKKALDPIYHIYQFTVYMENSDTPALVSMRVALVQLPSIVVIHIMCKIRLPNLSN